MGRLLLAVVSLAVIGFLAYKTMYGSMPGATDPGVVGGAPKRTLENVREKAKVIEQQDEQRAQDALKQTEE